MYSPYRPAAPDDRVTDQLDDDAREGVELARRRAEEELRASVVASRECSVLGLPGAPAAVALCAAYFA